jgi:hypothetical protein
MSVIVIRFERPAARRLSWLNDARRMLLALLGALDRLVPWPSGARQDAELPAEWFKYPPI